MKKNIRFFLVCVILFKAASANAQFLGIKSGSKKPGSTKSWDALTAGMDDAALSAKMLKSIQKLAKAEGWKETFSKLKIMDEKWRIERNEISGAITDRVIDAWVYATWPDGHCSYEDFVFREDYDGSGYDETPTTTGTFHLRYTHTCQCVN